MIAGELAPGEGNATPQKPRQDTPVLGVIRRIARSCWYGLLIGAARDGAGRDVDRPRGGGIGHSPNGYGRSGRRSTDLGK